MSTRRSQSLSKIAQTEFKQLASAPPLDLFFLFHLTVGTGMYMVRISDCDQCHSQLNLRHWWMLYIKAMMNRQRVQLHMLQITLTSHKFRFVWCRIRVKFQSQEKEKELVVSSSKEDYSSNELGVTSFQSLSRVGNQCKGR